MIADDRWYVCIIIKFWTMLSFLELHGYITAVTGQPDNLALRVKVILLCTLTCSHVQNTINTFKTHFKTIRYAGTLVLVQNFILLITRTEKRAYLTQLPVPMQQLTAYQVHPRWFSIFCVDIRLQRINSTTCDSQQCGVLTNVDSDDPVQPPFKLRNTK